MPDNYFTQEGLEKLKSELNYLKTVKEKEIAEALRYAASFGDLSENAAYHQAKEERKKFLDRVVELEQILRGAKVAEKEASGGVSLGCFVTLECDGQQETLQIVSPEEASLKENKISYQSPLGKCLMRKGPGEEVEVKTETSKTKYKIIEIR